MRYFRKIPGERVYLSPINTDDLEIYTMWLNDPHVTGFLGNYGDVLSLSSERSFLEKMAAGGYNFAIVRSEDDQLLGNISFEEVHPVSRRATVGLFIGEAENRGKGYGSEALRLMLDYGFRTLNLHNIMLYVHADNEPGLACYEKLGFREFGRRTESKFKDGRYVDVVHMEILDRAFLGEM